MMESGLTSVPHARRRKINNGTFLYIDGPDGAGKTTLVKKIIEANPALSPCTSANPTVMKKPITTGRFILRHSRRVQVHQ
jgi:ABC-type Mn2+/Zn2+ transport system ATPase subunit